jgi:hypothetical protein
MSRLPGARRGRKRTPKGKANGSEEDSDESLMTEVANAIRKITARMHRVTDVGHCSLAIDADDLRYR